MHTLFRNLLLRYPLFGWVLCVIGVVLICIGMSQLRMFHHVQETGVTTQGTLLSIKGEADEAADIEYSFDVNGKHYTGHGNVGAPERAGLHPGDKIEVKYLPDDPSQSVTGKSWASTPYMYNLVGAVLVLMPFASILGRRMRR